MHRHAPARDILDPAFRLSIFLREDNAFPCGRTAGVPPPPPTHPPPVGFGRTDGQMDEGLAITDRMLQMFSFASLQHSALSALPLARLLRRRVSRMTHPEPGGTVRCYCKGLLHPGSDAHL